MSEDWKVGDLAVCVDDSPARNFHRVPIRTQLEAGRVYRVTEIFAYPGQSGVHILLDGEPPHRVVGFESPGGWGCDRFRKIRPDTHEDCEPEFVELLQRIKRTVAA